MPIHTEEYKGFCIVVTEDKQAHYTARYLAKALNGSDSAHGESVETAMRHLKRKIDNIDIYNEHYTRPLEENELNRLISFIKSADGEMRIRLKLQKIHFFTQNDFSEIGIRAIINHTDVIQQSINSQGNSFQLNWAKASIGRDDFYAIYDLNYFDTDIKKRQLEDKLFNLGFEN